MSYIFAKANGNYHSLSFGVFFFYIWLLFLLEKYSKICPCDLDLANVKYYILK